MPCKQSIMEVMCWKDHVERLLGEREMPEDPQMAQRSQSSHKSFLLCPVQIPDPQNPSIINECLILLSSEIIC